ncbi:hypothetical protein B0H14DRAFT_2586675 [Mycena olivaceomarginata]|nr:hypothetical protein B0H14DRAFT_2586675 [Mycena olivaceomarginata]
MSVRTVGIARAPAGLSAAEFNARVQGVADTHVVYSSSYVASHTVRHLLDVSWDELRAASCRLRLIRPAFAQHWDYIVETFHEKRCLDIGQTLIMPPQRKPTMTEQLVLLQARVEQQEAAIQRKDAELGYVREICARPFTLDAPTPAAARAKRKQGSTWPHKDRYNLMEKMLLDDDPPRFQRLVRRQANIAIGLCVETISTLDGEGADNKILCIHVPRHPGKLIPSTFPISMHESSIITDNHCSSEQFKLGSNSHNTSTELA